MIYGKIGALAGAIGLVVIWPFAIGQIGQTVYERELQQIQSPNLSFENVSYQRGYFSSKVKTKIVIKDPIIKSALGANSPDSFILTSQLEHDIFSIKGESTIEMTPQIEKWIKALWSTSSFPVVMKTDISVLGDIQFDILSQAIDSRLEQMKITSSPLSLSGNFSKNDQSHFKLDIPLVSMSNKLGQTFIFDGLSGQGEGKMFDGFWLGDQSFDIKKIGFDDSKGVKVTLDALALKTHSKLKENGKIITEHLKNARLDSISSIYFKKLSLMNAFDLTDANATLSLNDMDYSSLVDLLVASKEYEINPDNQAVATLINALNKMSNKGFSAKLTPFEITTPNGEIQAEFLLDLVAQTDKKTQNSDQLQAKINGSILFHFPSIYLDIVPDFEIVLSHFEQYGFVSQAQNGVTFSAKIEDDTVFSPDGKSIPLSTLILDMM